MSAISPFPLIELSGSPRERGLAYGHKAQERILRSIALYSGQVQSAGCDLVQLETYAKEFIARIQSWAPDMIAEMEAIAEGAGVTFMQIMLVNARTELIQLVRRWASQQLMEPDGCTSVVALPEVTASGVLLHGQTWDWLAECVDTAVVLRIRRDDGPDILTFTEAGGLARNGMNSAGITLTANYLESDRDYRTSGLPLTLIRRRALEQKHLADAFKIVASSPKSTSNNMVVSSAEGFAVNFECAPDETFPILPQSGLIVHANHWQSPVALSKLKDAGLANMPDSLYRDFLVRWHLAARGNQITVDDVRAAFSDRFGLPYAVCRPPIPGMRGNLSATVATILFQPAAGLMEVTPLPAINSQTSTYNLSMDTDIRADARKLDRIVA